LKNYLYLVLIFIYACETPSQPIATQADTTTAPVTGAPPPAFVDAVEVPAYALLDTTVSFSGIWVNEIYVNKVRDFKTPCNSQNVMNSCIEIPDSTLKITRMISGFYEGAADIAVGFDRDHYVLYNTEPELMKEPVSDIDIISPDRMRIDSSYFIRMQYKPTETDKWRILEEILFSGHYKSEQGVDVTFTAEGKVTGLENISEYTAEIDYTGIESKKPINLLYMGYNKLELNRYCYRFSGDILFIYKTECLDTKHEHFCTEPVQSDLVYTLIKQPS